MVCLFLFSCAVMVALAFGYWFIQFYMSALEDRVRSEESLNTVRRMLREGWEHYDVERMQSMMALHPEDVRAGAAAKIAWQNLRYLEGGKVDQNR